ncbi:branched-chain amino acid aminotransferase [Heyndrickxia ginsengihumi]|uniref:Branched-chain-amino-acid aminotransferase n=1 Tax=Heyndrickxia ginsengihumi TaxID=363870 RepID=A0A0A6VH73_9BACI|nr:branched-chain amino acid aminotransferase [Heyndrickxia ginsengihumi]KHD86773.1 branched-chain amino acid aminotransferase [Heyndrickxia ginsengihumi]MBE6183755.1 branched-chain amino acid aminotransferase [Bacillus sp. (in: firmicutes)]MCM3022249.1 branched-chain amino acid aminotransferase [Heyndrickxia ginsengihumi]NEY18482.1 branched-chain amino acid aminotransferase [Heyndrickxia ginsengihumi]
MNQVIELIKTDVKKEKPAANALGFGKHFTDYMFVMDYNQEDGWHHPRITPYAPLVLDPSVMVFHYGQAIFEGLKAYRTKDGRVLLFRPEKNVARLNLSCQRMSIPQIDEEIVLDAIKQLVEIEKDWIPNEEGTSLYIRPFIIATEPSLGVHPSREYKLMVILSPVGSYYSDQLKPVRIYVEDEYVRAVPGGVGFVKTSGNYAASLKAQEKAELLGYDQVLWLDGVERKYIEEVGSMNIFFKINGEVVTPKLNGSILGGITRDSVIELLKHWNIPVKEAKISIDEINQAFQKGELEEVFGTGTAAVISPVGELKWKDTTMNISKGNNGNTLANRIYEEITSIQLGKAEDPFNWTIEIK